MPNNVSHSHPNTVFSYSLNGAVHRARLRCKQLQISYSVNSEESTARQTRAFYPRLRNQGTFAMTFDFNHWGEYSDAMTWFRDYAKLTLGAGKASGMKVLMSARDFARIGVPIQGMNFGDHIGSMLFSPTITFLSVADPDDVLNKNLGVTPSITSERRGQLSTTWFYPDSQMSKPGVLQNYLYDQQRLDDQNEGISDTVNPIKPPGGIGRAI